MAPPEAPERRPSPHRMVSSHTKRSFRSFSSSFEADDELSRSSGDQEDMGPDASINRYPGEDTRLTSKKELSGWYAYGFAAEVFVICGMGSYYSFSHVFKSFLDTDHRILISMFHRVVRSDIPRADRKREWSSTLRSNNPLLLQLKTP